jgi:hypothetical protein
LDDAEQEQRADRQLDDQEAERRKLVECLLADDCANAPASSGADQKYKAK